MGDFSYVIFTNAIISHDFMKSKAFVFLKWPAKQEICRSKDFLNRGLS